MVLALVGLLAQGLACTPALPEPTSRIAAGGVTDLPQPWPWAGHALPGPATFDDRLAVLGAALTTKPGAAGVDVDGRVWLQVTGDLAGRLKPVITLALDDTGTLGPVMEVPIRVALVPLEWGPGDVVEARVAASLVAPAGSGASSSMTIKLGLRDAGRDWRLAGITGTSRRSAPMVPVATVSLTTPGARAPADAGPSTGPGVIEARQRRGDIAVDGALDDDDWQRATPVTLRPWKTGQPLTQGTTVRMVWDPQTLYVAFDVDDDDIHSPYDTRDDPLYDGEATEVFIDADGDRDVYVELQSSAKDIHFDAAFAGGARQHMDTSYDVDFTTVTRPRAGGYTQEWRIPLATVKDIPAGEPHVGSQWRINVFRLERRRQAERVVGTEASALSPPERSDFHALDRFGTLVLSDR